MTPKDLNASLIMGARSGRLDIVEKALTLGADANSSDSFGLTAMHLAATNNNVRMIQVLMRHGASPFVRGVSGVSPFCAAVISGRLDAMRLLGRHSLDLESSPTLGMGTLEMALIARKFEVASWLIDNGADINLLDTRGESLLSRVINAQHAEAAQLLIGSGARITLCALHSALRINNVLLLGRLLTLRSQQIAQTRFLSDGLSLPLAEQALDALSRPTVGLEELEVSELDEQHAESLTHLRNGRRTSVLRQQIPSIKSQAKGALAVAAHRMNEWRDTLAWPYNYCKAFRTKKRTLSLFQAMRTTRPEEVIEILTLGEFDIQMVNGEGLTLLQAWLIMATSICSPSDGSMYNGHMSKEQEICLRILRELAVRLDHQSVIMSRFILSGNTVLHELIARGHAQLAMHVLSVDVIRVLVNASNDKLSRPLHLAAEAKDPHLMSALVNAGANINSLDWAGFSPLHISALMLDQGCLETAIALGANTQLTTRQGQTLDEILNQRRDQSESLRSIVSARRAFDSAKSIFSSDHPLASAIRRDTTPRFKGPIKPFVPGFMHRLSKRDVGEDGPTDAEGDGVL